MAAVKYDLNGVRESHLVVDQVRVVVNEKLHLALIDDRPGCDQTNSYGLLKDIKAYES